MTQGGKAAVVAIVALALALGLAACGGGDDSSSTGAATTAPGGQGQDEGASQEAGSGSGDAKEGKSQGSRGGKGSGSQSQSQASSGQVPGDTSASFQPRSHNDSGGGAGQFETKGGDNSIQEFGGETSSGEFAQAAAALHNYLDARAAHAWAASCEYLAGGVAEQLTQLSGAAGGGGQAKQPSCAEVVAGLSAGIPDSALREVAVADIGALRTEGDRAFLLFKGAHGTSYFIPMAREGGEWKVAAIAPSALG